MHNIRFKTFEVKNTKERMISCRPLLFQPMKITVCHFSPRRSWNKQWRSSTIRTIYHGKFVNMFWEWGGLNF